MLKRHEIKVLLRAGHAQAEVARLAGVSLRSVKRVAREGDIEHVDDAAERLDRGIGRPFERCPSRTSSGSCRSPTAPKLLH